MGSADSFAEILSYDDPEGRPGRIVTEGCRVAWDAATVAIFVAEDSRSLKLDGDTPFVLLCAQAQGISGGHWVHVAVFPRDEEAIGFRARADRAAVAGLPVSSPDGFEVEADALRALVETLVALGGRVATSIGHAEAMQRELPAPSLAAEVARRVDPKPTPPELDPTLSLEEVAARAAADERKKLLRAQAQSDPVGMDRDRLRAELKAARLEIAELRTEVDTLSQALERASTPGRELRVACPSCDTFGRHSMLRSAPVRRPEHARGLAAMCTECGWLGVVVIAKE